MIMHPNYKADITANRTKRPYRSLPDTLRALDRQIEFSLPYARTWSNFYNYDQLSAAQIFDHLKSVTIYKKDPENIELLQSMPALFLDNYWGTPGKGDCDCFTITACAVLLMNGFRTGYTLYGNDRQPTHIAADVSVKEFGRLRSMPFDLCAPRIDQVKDYFWKQQHKLTINALTATR
jgi:hypothetical protein